MIDSNVVPLTDEQRKLVEDHLYITDILTRTYYKHNSYEDLQQECRLVTCIAAQRYDPSKGASFSTLLYTALTRCIKGTILSYYNNGKKTTKPGEFQTIYFEDGDEKLADILEKLYQSTDICDDYVSRYITDVVLWEKLDSVFKSSLTPIRTRELVKEYLQLGMIHGFKNVGVSRYLQKKYDLSRQRYHQLIKRYMDRLREIWTEDLL